MLLTLGLLSMLDRSVTKNKAGLGNAITYKIFTKHFNDRDATLPLVLNHHNVEPSLPICFHYPLTVPANKFPLEYSKP